MSSVMTLQQLAIGLGMAFVVFMAICAIANSIDN